MGKTTPSYLLSTLLLFSSLVMSNAAHSETAVPFIINGQDISIQKAPWTALLTINFKSGAKFNCTGAVVSSKFVISAAHCLYDDENNFASSVDVFTGLDRRSSAVLGSAFHQKARDVYTITTYDITNFGLLDVAWVELESAVHPNAKAIAVADSATQIDLDLEMSNGKTRNLYASGWGRTTSGGNSSSVLRGGTLTGLRTDASRPSIYANPDPTNTCQGDSGGPLVWQDKNHASDNDLGYRLVGVTSGGDQACIVDGFYTALSYFDINTKQFISTIRPNSKFTVDIFDPSAGLITTPPAAPTPVSSGGGGGGAVHYLLFAALILLGRKRRY